MKIIKQGELKPAIKRITCENCGTIFEVEKNECNCTQQMGVMHDGLGSYNIKCPTCKDTQYFNWK